MGHWVVTYLSQVVRAEIPGSTPCKAILCLPRSKRAGSAGGFGTFSICVGRSDAISDFSQSFSLRASTLKSVDAAQSPRLCKDHV